MERLKFPSFGFDLNFVPNDHHASWQPQPTHCLSQLTPRSFKSNQAHACGSNIFLTVLSNGDLCLRRYPQVGKDHVCLSSAAEAGKVQELVDIDFLRSMLLHNSVGQLCLESQESSSKNAKLCHAIADPTFVMDSIALMKLHTSFPDEPGSKSRGTKFTPHLVNLVPSLISDPSCYTLPHENVPLNLGNFSISDSRNLGHAFRPTCNVPHRNMLNVSLASRGYLETGTKSFRPSRNLAMRMRSHPYNNGLFNCPRCQKGFTTPQRFMIHTKNHIEVDAELERMKKLVSLAAKYHSRDCSVFPSSSRCASIPLSISSSRTSLSIKTRALHGGSYLAIQNASPMAKLVSRKLEFAPYRDLQSVDAASQCHGESSVVLAPSQVSVGRKTQLPQDLVIPREPSIVNLAQAGNLDVVWQESHGDGVSLEEPASVVNVHSIELAEIDAIDLYCAPSCCSVMKQSDFSSSDLSMPIAYARTLRHFRTKRFDHVGLRNSRFRHNLGLDSAVPLLISNSGLAPYILRALVWSSLSRLLNGFFFSMPTSPTRGISRTPSGFESEPRIDEEISSITDDFEFEAGQNQEKQYKQKLLQNGKILPPMAYADELFGEGKVLPLKLPPRLQHVNSNKKHRNHGSNASSPGALSSGLKMPFSRQTLWNDDFDPFSVALEKVKDNGRMLKIKGNQLRRAKSLSPLKNIHHYRGVDRVCSAFTEHKNHSENGMIGMGLQKPVKATTISDSMLTMKTWENVDILEKSGIVKDRRRRIKRFLWKSESLTKMTDGDNRSYNSSNAIVKICRMLKTLGKPKLFLCRSFGLNNCTGQWSTSVGGF
ncbi:hypothetical protein Ancab_000207 [Ancistrocladus abbreviatus]